MNYFKDELFVKHIDGRMWEVLKDFSYQVKAKEVITVPKGFVCDFASIPRMFWSIIGHPTGKYGKAAIIHDFCYRRHLYPRKRCDEIFLEAMKILNVNIVRAKLMYRFVRSFGWIPWNRYPASDSLTDAV